MCVFVLIDSVVLNLLCVFCLSRQRCFEPFMCLAHQCNMWTRNIQFKIFVPHGDARKYWNASMSCDVTYVNSPFTNGERG